MVVMDVIVCPSPFIYWSPNPSVIVFGDWVFKEVIEVKWGHKSVSPNSVWLVSLEEEEKGYSRNVLGLTYLSVKPIFSN